MNEKLSGGEIAIRCLAEEGVDLIFGYPGGAALHLYDALFRQDRVKHILVRHEQAAAHMADGYARSTGKPGVVLVTSGPGATNTITGIATAFCDSYPMIILSGQVAKNLIGTDAFQETDMIGVSRPVVKHSFLISSVEEIAETMKKAFYIATSGKPGPVVVDFPKDMTDPNIKVPYKYPSKVNIKSYKPIASGHPKQVNKAVELILKAQKPIIYSGGGVILDYASKELVQFARMLNYPVTNTLMGLGAFPGDDKQFVGMLGMHGTVAANKTMHNSDLIIAIGARFDDRITNNVELFCPKAKIIHIDIDPSNVDKIIKTNVPIVGSAKIVLAALIEKLTPRLDEVNKKSINQWWDQINLWLNDYPLSYNLNNQSETIAPQKVIEELYNLTKDQDVILTSDVGQHQMFAALYYKFKKPLRWINSGGLGTMGFGLPAAMGAYLANPTKKVFCITGDGSIQMNIQELSTCLQYKIPIIIINLNNFYLGMVKQWQDMQYGRRHSSSYMDCLPDFSKLSQVYGHEGIKVTQLSQLKDSLEKAINMEDKLVFVDIHVDPEEHVYPMQIKGGSVQNLQINKQESIQ